MQLPDIPKSENPRVPVVEHPFRHITPVQMRFNDFDMLGHLNNAVYVSLLDLGKSSYFTHIMPDGIDWKHINMVVANLNCDFFAPTYISEEIAVLTQVASISERSFKMLQRVVNIHSGEVKCAATTIMAGFDPSTAQSAPIAPQWIDALSKQEGRELKSSNTDNRI